MPAKIGPQPAPYDRGEATAPWSPRLLLSGLIAVITMLVLIPPSSAQSHRSQSTQSTSDERLTELIDQLNLTEEQQTPFRAIMADHQAQQQALKQQGRGQGREAKQAIRQEVQALGQETDQRLAAVLTAEQLQAFKSWREDRLQRRASGRRGR